MILAHIFLPAMLLVICKSQQTSNHLSPALGNEETPNFFGSGGGGGGGGISPMPESSIPNVIGSDILLDRYRELIANSLLKLYDSCKVHDFLQNIRRNLENDNDDDSAKSTNNRGSGGGQQRYINAIIRLLEKQKDTDATLYLPTELSQATPKPALFYYVSISMLLQDQEFDEMLNYLLYEKCCRDDENFYGTTICDQPNLLGKRNTIKKVKFHSWGGKRSGGGGNVAANGARIPNNAELNKDVKQSKMVIRTPFRPWGGKRMQLN